VTPDSHGVPSLSGGWISAAAASRVLLVDGLILSLQRQPGLDGQDGWGEAGARVDG
jgi:hypothetical protein